MPISPYALVVAFLFSLCLLFSRIGRCSSPALFVPVLQPQLLPLTDIGEQKNTTNSICIGLCRHGRAIDNTSQQTRFSKNVTAGSAHVHLICQKSHDVNGFPQNTIFYLICCYHFLLNKDIVYSVAGYLD